MTEQKKDNRGYLFPNSNKSKPTQPDMTGKAIIKGVEQRIAAWENSSPEGKKHLSLIFSDPLPENTNSTNNASSGNSYNNSSKPKENNGPATAAPISDEFEDLDAILRSADDDNPFD